ncbi:MAG: hypothetical protein JNM66_10065 [Bryobacterales bacterium]|nr:hypothetical protein [Bryobacterales bacterium]
MTPFSPTSRYYGLAVKQLPQSDGSTLAFIARRLVPGPGRFATLEEHTVTQGERPDHVAAQRLGDPEQFWRLCDANAVLHPNELTATPGERIRVTLPEGIPGPQSA